MSLITPFLNQTVATILTPSLSVYGDSSLTATLQEDDGYTVKCRFVNKPKWAYGAGGVEEVTKAEAWVETDTVIDEGYRVRYGGKNYEVISVMPGINLDGSTEFKKVLLR